MNKAILIGIIAAAIVAAGAFVLMGGLDLGISGSALSIGESDVTSASGQAESSADEIIEDFGAAENLTVPDVE
jgi:hypothetical protein